MAFRRVAFALTIQMKAQGKFQKGKVKEEAHPQSRLSASETTVEERHHAWESDDWSSSQGPDDSWTQAAGWYSARAHTAWMAVPSLNLAYHPTHGTLDLGCTRSIGSRSAIERFQKHAWYHGIKTKFCRCNKSFCVRKFRNRNLLGKLHCSLSNNTTMFNHGWCAWDKWCTYFVLASSDEKSGYDYWTGSSRTQDNMPSFRSVFLSSWVFHNRTYCVGPDESYVTAHDKSSNRTGYPK